MIIEILGGRESGRCEGPTFLLGRRFVDVNADRPRARRNRRRSIRLMGEKPTRV